MTRRPPRRHLAATIAVGLMLLSGQAAIAQAPVEEETGLPDARMEGYAGGIPVKLKDLPGVAGTWAIFIVLAIVGAGVMFKSGNRSHLD